MLPELVGNRLAVKRAFPAGIIKNSRSDFRTVRCIYNYGTDRICSIVHTNNKGFIFHIAVLCQSNTYFLLKKNSLYALFQVIRVRYKVEECIDFTLVFLFVQPEIKCPF